MEKKDKMKQDKKSTFRWLFFSPNEEISGEPIENLSTEEKASLLLRQLVADQLKTSIDKIDINMGYFDMGITSVGIAKIAQSIEKKTDLSFQPILLLMLENGTISELAPCLAEKHSSTINKLVVTKKYEK